MLISISPLSLSGSGGGGPDCRTDPSYSCGVVRRDTVEVMAGVAARTFTDEDPFHTAFNAFHLQPQLN